MYLGEDAAAIAAENGGECVCDPLVQIRVRDRLGWVCSKGHEWSATFDSVKRGSWCPSCRSRRTKHTIDSMRALAAERGGACLSDTYVNNKTHLEWQCSEGHRWHTAPCTVLKGSWCRSCSAAPQRNTLESARDHATDRGGECLSGVYTKNSHKLRWRCVAGHEWQSTYINVVKHDHWCPYCFLKGEQRTREVFERLTGERFVKCRPFQGNALELDGYCEKLGVAFEHHGPQHYGHHEFFHMRDGDSFEAQVERDLATVAECDTAGIALIVVPHDHPDVVALVREELDLLGLL